MIAVNSVQLIGNLTKDPESRATTGGTDVCSFRVAVNNRRKQGEKWVNKPGYFDVTVFGNLATVCAEYLGKGRKVAISGRLDYQEWTTENDQKRSKVEVIASEVSFLSPAPEASDEEPAAEETTKSSGRKSKEKAAA